jgi:hypothetical protein
MQSFTCDTCGGALYFENDTCLRCGSTVGFRPDRLVMATAAAADAAGLGRCDNWLAHAACNWFTDGGDGGLDGGKGYCIACGLNEVVPDLADAQQRALWIDTERAKRRLLFTLLELELPFGAFGEKQALRFRLLAGTGGGEKPVLTGHADGCLTVNVAEADDAHRETQRLRLNERYRTMLGHLRHEIGHYYWYRLVGGTPLMPKFRERFGDETADYAEALRRHYEEGPAEGWEGSFVSAYASVHPWEDFAESFAHYIHILDTLETASASGVTVGGRELSSPLPLAAGRSFAEVLADWAPLTVCLNQLNRSMGMPDAYPFVIAPPIVGKLELIHEVCMQAPAQAQAQAAGPRL